MSALSREELTRFSRHILLPELGRSGQERLRSAKVAIVGLGGLGCPAALYLAAAGVGEIGLIDSDAVELSNLQRQILHQSQDLGRPKVVSAGEKLLALDPAIAIKRFEARLDRENVLGLLRDFDVLLEGSDNFKTKFLVSDAAVSLGKTAVLGGILRFEGQLMSVKPGQSACYRCVFENAPAPDAVPNCAEAGVLGAVAGVLGTLMANEALKILLGLGQPLYDRILHFDAQATRFRETPLKKNERCPSCRRALSAFQPDEEMEGGVCEP